MYIIRSEKFLLMFLSSVWFTNVFPSQAMKEIIVSSSDDVGGMHQKELFQAAEEAVKMEINRRKRSAPVPADSAYEEYEVYEDDYEEYHEGYEEHDDEYEEDIIDVGPGLEALDSKFIGKVEKVSEIKNKALEHWFKILGKIRKVLFKLWEKKHLKKDKDHDNERVLYAEAVDTVRLYKEEQAPVKHTAVKTQVIGKSKKLKLPEKLKELTHQPIGKSGKAKKVNISEKYDEVRHPANAKRRYLNLSRMLGISPN